MARTWIAIIVPFTTIVTVNCGFIPNERTHSSKISFAEAIVPMLTDKRIVGGEPANIEDYPYQVSVQAYGSHICGGLILGPNLIATAAHCCDGLSANNVNVRAGSSNRGSGGQLVDVLSIIINPSYNPRTMDYDACKLILKTPLQFGPGVNSIGLCLTRPNDGTACSVTGWGTLSSGGSLPIQLQTVSLPIYSNADCKNSYGSSAITPRMICAGYPQGGKDACQGDSGGPMACNGCLAGLTSWGAGCGAPNYPGVYAKVDILSELGIWFLLPLP